MAALAKALADVLAPWINYYNYSNATELIITFLHLGGLFAAGGLAFGLDRAVLRSGRHPAPSREDVARELGQAHTVILIGLGVVVLSGLAMTAADPKTYLVSKIFWLKMFAVLLLLANGWVLKRAGERLVDEPDEPTAFRRLRRSALRSMGLWLVTVLAGVALTVYS
jgi:hypothetical protein